jgi:ADP-ribosyl-[dinitrogen reductase] hydrolase
MQMTKRALRIRNSLWGLFAGDALAMPAHWFYSLENLKEAFDGGLTRYEAPPHPHPESFMVGMTYLPDLASAQRLDRRYDILHEHARFYETSFARLEIETGERESEHGNATPSLEERYHYHHGLQAGENTTAAQLVRVLMRTVIEQGRYDEGAFLENFVDFMTSPGPQRKDPYLEIYLRCWFENYAGGIDLRNCAETQRKVWSIGSHGGMIRPMALSLLAPTSYQGLGFAIEHQNLTHRSENVAGALGISIPLLHDLLDGVPPLSAAAQRSAPLRPPRLTGNEMHETYRRHHGPGNIPNREMWELHTHLSEDRFDLQKLVTDCDDEDVVLRKFGTACYPEHGLPLALFLAANHGFEPEAALLANANAGGDNVHRGAVLGLLVGAAVDEFPEHLKAGLADAEALEEEINAFAEVATSGSTF